VYRRAQLLMISIAATMTALAILAAVIFDTRLVDPDGFIGPSYLRLPTILGLAFAIDLVPRTLWVSRCHPARMRAAFMDRVHRHWTKDRMALVVSGLLCFYFTYVSYRNLKSQLPAVEGNVQFDRELSIIDQALFLGHQPATVLHTAVGSGLSAEVLSTVYLWFLPLVPLALTAWLIWSRNIGFGYWFATSQCIAWTLGTISYYALPTVGPGIYYPWRYGTVNDSHAASLMTSLQWGRLDVIDATSPSLKGLTASLQSVAGFASLHCAITLLVAMMIQYTVRNRILQIVFWVNFCLTCVATLYFGWHYVADDIAGIAIALVSFYVGGWASHQSFARHRTEEQTRERVTTM
jgi:hypothetical protein